MADYTVLVKDIWESQNPTGRTQDWNMITASYAVPHYVEEIGAQAIANFRKELNGKIYQHFWLREIGSETITQFLHRLNAAMYECMEWIAPIYNLRYKSLASDSYLLGAIDTSSHSGTVTDAHSGTISDSSTNSTTDVNASTVNGTGKNIYSDLPDNLINTNNVFTSNTYATNANMAQNNSTTSGNHTINGTNNNQRTLSNSDTRTYNNSDSNTHNISGMERLELAEKMIRERMFDIDNLVFEYLEDLFMQVF